VADDYRDLAADYDWLFDDEVLTGGFAINQPAVAGLLQQVGPGRAVLDAACGTGVDAAALARRGFHVRAADGSDAMVQAAAARFRREGLAISVQQCLWADLPDTIDERFDVVLCTGNALVHAAGRDAMVQALTGLRRMACAGGHVVIHSRNWEKLHAERRIVQVANRVRTRGGRRCVMLYAWEVPDRLDQEHIAISCSSSRTATGSSRTSTGSRSFPLPSATCANGSSSRDCGKSAPTSARPQTNTS